MWWFLLPFALIDILALSFIASGTRDWLHYPAGVYFVVLNMVGGLAIWLALAVLAFSPSTVYYARIVWGLHAFGNVAFSLVWFSLTFRSQHAGTQPPLACPYALAITLPVLLWSGSFFVKTFTSSTPNLKPTNL